MNDQVRQTLKEILIKHGRPPLTDSRLCESLLKDYCPDSKEEISLLVGAVREHVAADLSLSQDAVPRQMLRDLLVKRLRKNLDWGEGDARWVVESWRLAIRDLIGAESHAAAAPSSPLDQFTPVAHDDSSLVSTVVLKPGVIGRCRGAVRTVAAAPADETIASGGDDALIRLWHLRSGKIEIVGRCEASVSSVAFSPNGALLASASGNSGPGSRSTIQLWDLQSREGFALGECGVSPLIVFSPGGKSLAAGSLEAESSVQIWNLQTGQMRVLKSGRGGVSSISFSADGRNLATADGGLTSPAIRVWDLETGRDRVLGHSQRQITALACSPNGPGLISGSWDETVRLWDSSTGEVRVLGRNCSCITCLAYSPQGNRVVASSLDGSIRIWDVRSAKSRTIGQYQGVNAVAFFSNGANVVTGNDDGTVYLWDASRFM